MVLNDFVTTKAPNIPEILVGKLTMTANYELTDKEVRIFGLALNAISHKLKQDNINKNDLTNVCKKEYKGIFSHFRELDELIALADEKLCSDDCPCIITNYT